MLQTAPGISLATKQFRQASGGMAAVLESEDFDSGYGGRIRQLVLNRPDALNAISVALLSELEEQIYPLVDDRSTRALIVTGSGRAFCTGADLKERRSMSDEEVRRFLDRVGRLFTTIEDLHCPTIVAINGFALGGGLELALTMDFRLAAQSASMGLTETSLGIIPGAGGTQRLSRVVGPARAKEMILSARRYDAISADRFGLLSAIVPDEQLRASALDLARSLSRNAPIAMAQAKLAIQRGFEVDRLAGLEIERKAYEVTIPTQDRTEALAAFREKRDPVFQGK